MSPTNSNDQASLISPNESTNAEDTITNLIKHVVTISIDELAIIKSIKCIPQIITNHPLQKSLIYKFTNQSILTSPLTNPKRPTKKRRKKKRSHFYIKAPVSVSDQLQERRGGEAAAAEASRADPSCPCSPPRSPRHCQFPAKIRAPFSQIQLRLFRIPRKVRFGGGFDPGETRFLASSLVFFASIARSECVLCDSQALSVV